MTVTLAHAPGGSERPLFAGLPEVPGDLLGALGHEISEADRLALVPTVERETVLGQLGDSDITALAHDWRFWGRAPQIMPDGDWKVWLLLAGRGYGKLLDVMTPIPTPTGWTTMGEIRVGDQVFDEGGVPCNVTSVSLVQFETTYRVRFSDGASLVAGGSHQWVTWTHAARKSYRRSDRVPDKTQLPINWPTWRSRPAGFETAQGPQIRTTDEIRGSLRYGKRGDRNHSVPLAGALVLPEIELPIDPYVLGVWLGDGSSAGAEITTADPQILELMEAAGYAVGRRHPAGGRSFTVTIGGSPAGHHPETGRFATNHSLRAALSALALIPDAKHIPGPYLRASAAQRLALLQGLMDSDGHCAPTNGQCEFSSTRERLADGVMELAISLGLKPTLIVGRSRLYGRDCGEKYRILFTAYFPVFRLDRKTRNQRPRRGQALRQSHRMIVAIDEVPAVAMRCISVDSPNHLYLAGRAMVPTHNTRCGGEGVRMAVESGRARRVALIAPTAADARDVMVEGESGILAISPPWNRPEFEPSKRRLTWPNGAIATTYSADEPERLRGPQHDFAWCDELAAWRFPEAWDMLQFGLRLGSDPRTIVTTTPRPTKLVRALVGDPETVITRGSTLANRSNLASSFLKTILARYAGTRLGRQEIDAEILEDAAGALWQATMFEADGFRRGPGDDLDLERIVVAIDPAVTSGDDADETGIIVAGRDHDGHGYVLADGSGRHPPTEWAKSAIALYRHHHADRIVAEVNNGGDMVENTVRMIDPNVAYTAVRASRGKVTRAEPIAALYEQGRVHHVGYFPALEDQMLQFTGNFDRNRAGYSPDRVDALVWAFAELMIQRVVPPPVFGTYGR